MSECRERGCGERVYLRRRCKAHHLAWHAETYPAVPGVRRHRPHWEPRAAVDPRISLLAQYGLTPEDYDLMLRAQDGLCAICRRPDNVPGRSLAVDHCHDTGKVRGLLCGTCNQALGMFQDDPVRLTRAYEYLIEAGRRLI